MTHFPKLIAFLAFLLPGAALAQQWGAVGIGPGGAYGYAHDWNTERQAYGSAARGCEWDCTEIRTFFNTCAAMAVASNGGWGWGTGASRGAAESRAMGYCRQYGNGCRVRVWACSG
ncbi:DUF4189 domain-containing protein [Maritimibacter sp. DP07]|uniref:DUF4189 domain-containing protein n=1 Tax=Maritimibacter harenae TaxID=2606218 RepID=A0A845M8L0_9RHOB|nr:DUF4189 domain-containing protein [Maritimibacter harenae]MZR15148.1 DUF4189 domain-containing protein [Maritimibacter harenae]